MTNNQILEQVTAQAVESGIINESEQLHTFQHWKEYGYSVRKGEHAKVTTKLWKCTSRKKDDEEVQTDRWFMTKAFLFSSSQVERLQQN